MTRRRPVHPDVVRILAVLPSDRAVTTTELAGLAEAAGIPVDAPYGIPHVGGRPVGAMLRALRRKGWATVRTGSGDCRHLRTPAGDAAVQRDET